MRRICAQRSQFQQPQRPNHARNRHQSALPALRDAPLLPGALHRGRSGCDFSFADGTRRCRPTSFGARTTPRPRSRIWRYPPALRRKHRLNFRIGGALHGALFCLSRAPDARRKSANKNQTMHSKRREKEKTPDPKIGRHVSGSVAKFDIRIAKTRRGETSCSSPNVIVSVLSWKL